MGYGIKKHTKGSSYANDCLMCDKDYRVIEVSRETAEMLLRQFHYRYGDEYSFKIVRLS